MKKFLLALLLFPAFALLSPAQSLTVIRAGSLIDGQSKSPKKNQLIFVRGDKIEKITDASQSIPSDAKLIDLSNSTVLPGLIDSHTHLRGLGDLLTSNDFRRFKSPAEIALSLKQNADKSPANSWITG